MNRRDLLRGAGAALGGGAVAGCLSNDGGEPDSDATNATDSTDTTGGSGGLGSGADDTATPTEDGSGDESSGTARETTAGGTGGDGHSITTTGTDCRSEDDADAASVTVAAGEVEVSGTVVVSDPCHAAAFGAVERRDGDLVVVVEPADDGKACMQCEGVVGYAATIAVDDPPATVTVKHRSRGRTRTVETVSA